jgi:hypothetical protein
MGIGAAWNEGESLAYGIPFHSVKERFVRLEEAIQIIRKMWTDEPSTSFNGRYYQIKNAYNLFGSAEKVKRKLSILKEHCSNVRRDYESILKTKLGVVVIDDDKETAGKRLQQIIKVKNKLTNLQYMDRQKMY